MILEPQEQLKNFLEKSKDVLVIIPESPNGDIISSAWAFSKFLKKTGINSSDVAFSGKIPFKLEFLPRPETVVTEITGARDFVLSFDTSRNKIMKIETEQKDHHFNIYLTPEKGAIDPRDFSFIPAKFKYDLLIVIGSPDKESLGKIFEENTDLFFEIPIANIDNKSHNENFGQINLVEVTASSCSEIIYNLMESFNPNLIDDQISQCILAGIISATDSFQKKNTTPKSLLLSAKLMESGADQQEIIRWLYKTQELSILKLYGRATAKLKSDPAFGIVWSEVSVEDFVQSRSKPEDLETVIDKLQENYSEGKIFALIYNDTPLSSVIIAKTVESSLLKKVQTLLGGQLKQEMLEIKIENSNLEEVGGLLYENLKKLLS